MIEFFVGNQTEWIEPTRGRVPPPVKAPKRHWVLRATGYKVWRVDMRLEAFPDRLDELFASATKAFPELSIADAKYDDDKAIYIVGCTYGWTERMAAENWIAWIKERWPDANGRYVGGGLRISR